MESITDWDPDGNGIYFCPTGPALVGDLWIRTFAAIGGSMLAVVLLVGCYCYCSRKRYNKRQEENRARPPGEMTTEDGKEGEDDDDEEEEEEEEDHDEEDEKRRRTRERRKQEEMGRTKWGAPRLSGNWDEVFGNLTFHPKPVHANTVELYMRQKSLAAADKPSILRTSSKVAPENLLLHRQRYLHDLQVEARTSCKKHRLFQRHSIPAIEHLLERAHHRGLVEVPAGEEMFRRGEEGSSLFVLMSGELGCITATGKEVAVLQAGAIFGELAALRINTERTVTVIAKTEACCWQIEADEFEESFPNPAVRTYVDDQTALQRTAPHYRLGLATDCCRRLFPLALH